MYKNFFKKTMISIMLVVFFATNHLFGLVDSYAASSNPPTAVGAAATPTPLLFCERIVTPLVAVDLGATSTTPVPPIPYNGRNFIHPSTVKSRTGILDFSISSPYPTITPSPTNTPTPTNTPVGLSPTPFPVSNTNLALNKTSVCSSEEDNGLAAQFVVDGNASSRWSSQHTDNQWIYVDLGSKSLVQKVVLKWEAAYGKDYKIQYSNNSTNWTDIKTITGDGNDDIIEINSPVEARYVRMLGIARGTEYGYSLYEFEVYGYSLGATPTMIPPKSAYSRIEAENFNEQDGIQIESGCADAGGGQLIGQIGNGDSVGYNNIDFDTGASSFEARVAASNEGAGGIIEVRLDYPAGELIGFCELTETTGGWGRTTNGSASDWRTISGLITKDVKGIHKVYLYFKGPKSKLFNVNYIKFYKNPFNGIEAESCDDNTAARSLENNYKSLVLNSGTRYKFGSLYFGDGNGNVILHAWVKGNKDDIIRFNFTRTNADGTETTDIRPVTLNTNGWQPITLTYLKQGAPRSKLNGYLDMYITFSNAIGNSTKAYIDRITFEAPVEDFTKSTNTNQNDILSTSIKGHSVNIDFKLDNLVEYRNHVYEVYFYTTELHPANKQIFNVNINNIVDTINLHAPTNLEKSQISRCQTITDQCMKFGPYLVKAQDNLSMDFTSLSSSLSISAVEINRVTYTAEFPDVKFNNWAYIPIMELASQGILSGKDVEIGRTPNNKPIYQRQFGLNEVAPTPLPGDPTPVPFPAKVTCKEVSSLLLNVMKRAHADANFGDFKTVILNANPSLGDEINTLNQPANKENLLNALYKVSYNHIPTSFWSYRYIQQYREYFNDGSRKDKPARREEFAMAMVGAKRFDYTDNGRVYVLDPNLEKASKLNKFKSTLEAQKPTYRYEYFLELALEKGLLGGKPDGLLYPRDYVTRAEAAQMMFNAYSKLENNFRNPGKKIPIPSILKSPNELKEIRVGILPLKSTLSSGTGNDPNPDFTLMEALNRNINKPMDWELFNPHPPVFDSAAKSALLPLSKDTSITNTGEQIINSIPVDTYTPLPTISPSQSTRVLDLPKSNIETGLRKIVRLQTDLDSDIKHDGAQAMQYNINKSKFFRYWEVEPDCLEADRLASDYDILFQTSHGKVTYSPETKAKMESFLNKGGQLWWENCGGLDVVNGDFSGNIKFKRDYKYGVDKEYRQYPVYEPGTSNMKPILDGLYKISPYDSPGRILQPLGITTNNNATCLNEITMLGDGDDWGNTDCRWLETGTTTANVIDDPITEIDTESGRKPNLIVRTFKDAAGNQLGRMIVSSADIGDGITKFVYKQGGKGEEDYKFCYNTFSWMSRVRVEFTSGYWLNGLYYLNAKVTNTGIRQQTYNLTTNIESIASDLKMIPTTDYSVRDWINQVDSKGYPSRITLNDYESVDIVYKLQPQSTMVNPVTTFELTARNLIGASDSYTAYRDICKMPLGIHVDNINIKTTAPHGINADCRIEIPTIYNSPVDPDDIKDHKYQVTIKLLKQVGTAEIDPNDDETYDLLNPSGILNNIMLSDSSHNNTDDTPITLTNISSNPETKELTFIVHHVKFDDVGQKIVINADLNNLTNHSTYKVLASIEVSDEVTGASYAISDNYQSQSFGINQPYAGIKIKKTHYRRDKGIIEVTLQCRIPKYSNELPSSNYITKPAESDFAANSYIEFYDKGTSKYDSSAASYDSNHYWIIGDSLTSGSLGGEGDLHNKKVLVEIKEGTSANLSPSQNFIEKELKVTMPINKEIYARITSVSTSLGEARISEPEYIGYKIDHQ